MSVEKCLALVVTLMLATVSFPAAAQEAPQTMSIPGKCQTSYALPSVLRNKEGATKVSQLPCDGLVITKGKFTLTNARAPVIGFTGQDRGDMTVPVQTIQFGQGPIIPAVSGRCEVRTVVKEMLFCHAIYLENGQRVAVVMEFEMAPKVG